MPEMEARKRLHAILSAQSERIEREWAEAVARLDSYADVSPEDHRAMASRMFKLMLEGLAGGDLSEMADHAKGSVEGKMPVQIASAQDGLRAIMACRQPVCSAAERAGRTEEEVAQLRTGAALFIDNVCAKISDNYCSGREREAEAMHQLLRQLSTPVIQVWEEILVLPLVGTLDPTRAEQVIENLLDQIANQQARAAIIDVTGVTAIDSHVASHLLKTVRAARILGAQVVLTGIQPQMAQTMVRLGLDLTELVTCGSLQAGLRECFRLTGRTIET